MKKSLRKIIFSVTVAIIAAFAITACSNEKASSGKISIVTTIFPEYDWVNEILGENPAGAEVTMLLDNGADLHSYQPTANDILKISTCDIFIYVGGESDEWIDDALNEAVNEDMIVINLLDVLGEDAKEEEIKEGMEAEEEEEIGEEANEEEEVEYDEHVWLSLKNAAKISEKIAEALEAVDEANKETYNNNLETYKNKLAELDLKYEETVANSTVKTVLFGDRFPFRYLVNDYGLDYYAAFVGCSAETEASFETIAFLANKVDELKLNSVLTIETSDGKIAQTIIDNTAEKNQKVLKMDSMQSTTKADVEAGKSYLNTMEENLNVLSDALK